MRSLAFLLVLVAFLLLPASSALADPDWTWPVRGPVLTQFRNGDDPYAAGQHRGIDIGAAVGTPVVAAASGTVVYSGVVGSSGLTVAERAGDYELSYLHLSSVAVRSGEQVDAGERLGAVGVSGTRSAEQPHLHFGVRQAADRHAYLDPLRFLALPLASDPEPQPAPVPVHDPLAAPAPVVVAPAPMGQPVAAPVPVGVRSHSRVPRVVTTSHVVASLRRAPVASPRFGATPRVTAHPAHHSAAPARSGAGISPAHGPATRLAASRAYADAPVREPHSADRTSGIDVAWLAACLGLVLAAVLLARPRSRGPKRQSARSALAALLRAAARPARARARQ